MKIIITLLLMVTILFTFTQKVMASAPLIESEIKMMANCEMQSTPMALQGVVTTTNHCPSDCEMMNVTSALHFVEHESLISFDISQLHYPRITVSSAYYFPESLYRPPFLS